MPGGRRIRASDRLGAGTPRLCCGVILFSRHDPHRQDKQKLLARVRRIRGQADAVERALESEAGCDKVMHLLASTRAAMAGLMSEVVEDHVLSHLVDPVMPPGALNGDAAEQLLDVVRTYLK